MNIFSHISDSLTDFLSFLVRMRLKSSYTYIPITMNTKQNDPAPENTQAIIAGPGLKKQNPHPIPNVIDPEISLQSRDSSVGTWYDSPIKGLSFRLFKMIWNITKLKATAVIRKIRRLKSQFLSKTIKFSTLLGRVMPAIVRPTPKIPPRRYSITKCLRSEVMYLRPRLTKLTTHTTIMTMATTRSIIPAVLCETLRSNFSIASSRKSSSRNPEMFVEIRKTV